MAKKRKFTTKDILGSIILVTLLILGGIFVFLHMKFLFYDYSIYRDFKLNEFCETHDSNFGEFRNFGDTINCYTETGVKYYSRDEFNNFKSSFDITKYNWIARMNFIMYIDLVSA